MSNRRISRIGITAAVLAAVVAVGTACSSNDSTAADDTAGVGDVTLTVGDQVKGTQSLLEASGELKNLPYKIKWATFEAGPPLLEAAAADKIDFGGTGDVPPVFAQSAGSPLKIVAVTSVRKAGDYLLVPEGSSIKSVAELKGKKVAFTKGSSSNGLVLAALKQAGLKPSDITETFLSPSEGLAAFTSGQVDAWAVWNPYAAVAKSKGKPRVLADGTNLTSKQTYYLASKGALADSAKDEALKDLVGRIARAQRWAATHEDQWVPIFSKLTTLPEQVAKATFESSSGSLVPIDDAVIGKQQRLIDLFADAKVIPNHPKAADYFDARYNAAVESEGAGS
ncbi:MAG: ABC transporter substrate-binding protein [Gordonia sp. (in: high G+C Gram-positive bacteria)]